MSDEILDEVARVRAKLLETHGGIDGYFQHLQVLDQARIERQAQQVRKTTKSGSATRKQSARARKT